MFKGFSLWAGVISGGLAQLKDTQAVTTGHMDKKEYAIQTSQNVTGGIGIMAGIEYGGCPWLNDFAWTGNNHWNYYRKYGGESDWKLCRLSSR